MTSAVRRVNSIVIFILTLFSILYINAFLLVILPSLLMASYAVGSQILRKIDTLPSAMLHLIIISYTTFSTLCLYLLCVLVDPGKVPTHWIPDEEINNSVVQVKKTTGKYRYCQKCQTHKPPRSHHCRICKRCVLRMDHHCQWMNNCIGHRNYRSFISFLFFLLLSLMHSVYLTAFSITSHQRSLEHESHDSHIVHVVILVFSCIIWVIILGLFLWHLALIVSNKTSIEYYEGVHADVASTSNGTTWHHPYDLGRATNYVTMFGRSTWKWILPFTSLEGDGLDYRTISTEKRKYHH